jgi:hypothetical protein
MLLEMSLRRRNECFYTPKRQQANMPTTQHANHPTS